MKNLLCLCVLAGVALFAGRAQAQESHRFNAKTLAAKYELPVYPTKGHVLNDEVIESTDDVEHKTTAVYSLKGDYKKAVDFYTKELGTPKQETSDTGIPRWIFKKDEAAGSKVRHRVLITYDKHSKLVNITLWTREYESAADAEY
jgi:hypothetical protein